MIVPCGTKPRQAVLIYFGLTLTRDVGGDIFNMRLIMDIKLCILYVIFNGFRWSIWSKREPENLHKMGYFSGAHISNHKL